MKILRDLVILKLGGSVVTDKEVEFKAKKNVIKEVAEVISDYKDIYSFIFVHGGGSYGHPVAKKYKVNLGLSHSSYEGLVETRKAMQRLNYIVVDELSKLKLPVVSIQPSAIFMLEDGKYKYNFNSVEAFLNSGFFPVLYGDAIYNNKQEFSILSGDTIIKCLARQFHPKLIIFGCDVDGVYTDDPKVNPKAQLISNIDENFNFSKFGYNKEIDVTGGIVKKLEEMLEISKLGSKSWIINLENYSNLRNVLDGKNAIGTEIG